MTELLQDHQAHTQRSAQVVVADSKYGTTANFLDCYDRGILAHIPVLKQTQDKQERRSKIFPESMFVYDPETDTYTCPAGQPLRRRKHWVERKAFEYVTSRGVCQQCTLRLQCTRSQSAGRTIKRHERQEILDSVRMPGTEPMGKKRYQGPSAFHGTIVCSRETIWTETSAVAWSLAGSDSGLLDCRCAEHRAD